MHTGNCLHLIVSAADDALNRCVSQFSEGDTAVFLGDGVMLLALSEADSLHSIPRDSLFSREDLDARGLLPLARKYGVRLTDDTAFAALLARHRHCLTWR